MNVLTVFALEGMPEVEPGDDLAALVIAAVDAAGDTAGNAAGDAAGNTAGNAHLPPALADGDILAVTSKIVSKAEGRIVAAADREQAITDETVRVVATRVYPGGVTRIVENRLGIVGAAAGVDASNTAAGTVLLLPVDPDASAAALRARLQEHYGVRLGVVITDTLGRAWREGQTDVAIGGAGVLLLDDLSGTLDASGHELAVTAPAIGDEIASAADLVKRKASGCPVAVVRGLADYVVDDAPGARVLIRDPAKDMFSLGTAEARREGYENGHADGLAAGRASGSETGRPSESQAGRASGSETGRPSGSETGRPSLT